MSKFALAVIIWLIVLLIIYQTFFSAFELHKEAVDDEILLTQVIFMDIGAFIAFLGGIAAINFVSNMISPKGKKQTKGGRYIKLSDEKRHLYRDD